MSDEEIKKDTVFLDELTIRLRQRQIHCSRDEEFLIATMEGHPVARVDVNGDIYQRKTDLDTPTARELYYEVLENVHEVSEYLKQMERSPSLHAEGVRESFKLLAEYKNTVFCACQYDNGMGVQFVTWNYTYDRKGVTLGHYFGNEYQAAKQDFAVRSGLVQEQRVFSGQQLSEIYRCVKFTEENSLILTDESYKTLQKISDQIEQIAPNVVEHVNNVPTQGMEMNTE